MATYYHVTTAAYNEGEDLLSWDRYIERYGEAPCAWKWDGSEPGMIDGDLVSLLREEQANEIDTIASYIDGDAIVLTIETDETWEQELGFTFNDEGYTAARYGCIPAELIVATATIVKPREKAAKRPNIATCTHLHLGPLMDSTTGREAVDQHERPGTFRICADCGAWTRY